MNAAPNKSYYTAGTSDAVEISGAVVLKGVIAVPADTGVAGAEIEFKTGGSGGDTLYSMTIIGVHTGSSNALLEGGAFKLQIPGSGIRFDSGLYFEPIVATVHGITIIYQGGDVS